MPEQCCFKILSSDSGYLDQLGSATNITLIILIHLLVFDDWEILQM